MISEAQEELNSAMMIPEQSITGTEGSSATEFKIVKQRVNAKSRKLKAGYSSVQHIDYSAFFPSTGIKPPEDRWNVPDKFPYSIHHTDSQVIFFF